MILVDPSAHPVIAHRGNRAHAPENTLDAFQRAWTVGADAFECDVRLTSDGHVVVMHDATVNRTTNGSGAVASFSLAAIRKLDAGAKWSPHADPDRANGGVLGGPRPFAGKKHIVPLLAEVLDAFPATPVIIEFKTVDVAARAARIIQEHGAADRVLIGAFPAEALMAARLAGFPTVATRGELARLLPAALFGRRARARLGFNAIAIPPSWHGVAVPIIGYTHAANVPVHVWTVNDPEVAAEYWNRGVCGIVTDDPAAMRSVRERVLGR